MTDHYILAAHGSSSGEANDAIRGLAERLAARLDGPVTAAFLERAEPSILDALVLASDSGAARVILLPFFLMPGMHVRRDLGEIVHHARERGVREIVVTDYLGAHPGIADVLVDIARSATQASPV